MNLLAQSRRHVWTAGTAGLLGLIGAMALDSTVYRHLHLDDSLRHDWARFFRIMGWLPTWLIAGTTLWLVDSGMGTSQGRRSSGRGLFLALSAGACGIAGEVLKLIVRRERPDMHDGGYVFRSFSDHPWSSSGLGFPSSHASVAFGAAWALWLLFPRARPVWIGLAAGCSLTRLLDRAHFLSDCYGAAVLSLLIVWLLARLMRPVDPTH